NAIAKLAAEKLVNGQSERLAGEIPQRGLDRRERCKVHARLRAAEHARGADFVEQPVNVERIPAAQHPPPAEHELGRAAHRVGALAVTDDVLVRVDLHEQVAAAADVADLEVGDLQVRRTRIRAHTVETRLRLLSRGGERRRRKGAGTSCAARKKLASGILLVVVHAGLLRRGEKVSDTLLRKKVSDTISR